MFSEIKYLLCYLQWLSAYQCSCEVRKPAFLVCELCLCWVTSVFFKRFIMNEGLGQCQMLCFWLFLLFPCKLFMSLKTRASKWKLPKWQEQRLKCKASKQPLQGAALWTWVENATKSNEYDSLLYDKPLSFKINVKVNRGNGEIEPYVRIFGQRIKENKSILNSLWRYQGDKWTKTGELLLVPLVSATVAQSKESSKLGV